MLFKTFETLLLNLLKKVTLELLSISYKKLSYFAYLLKQYCSVQEQVEWNHGFERKSKEIEKLKVTSSCLFFHKELNM